MEKIPSEEILLPKEKNFIDDTCNALLSIERPSIAAEVIEKAGDLNLQEKPEFHISVLASRNGKLISEYLAKIEDSEEIINQIKRSFLNREWLYQLLPEYFLMEKYYDEEEVARSGYVDVPPHTRSTIIQKIRMEDLKEYFHELSVLTGIDFKLPLPHITLFSGSDYSPMESRGIGIYSEDDFNRMVKTKL